MAVVASVALPALAADLSPPVAVARAAMDAAAGQLELAGAELSAARVRVATLEVDRDAAQAARDAAAAVLRAAEAARHQAEEGRAAADAAATAAAAARDRAGQRLLVAVERQDGHRRDLRALAVETYKHGGDGARLAGVVDALTSSRRDVGTTLAAVERLGFGTDRTFELSRRSNAMVAQRAARRSEAATATRIARDAAEQAARVLEERRADEALRGAEAEAAAGALAVAEAELVAGRTVAEQATAALIAAQEGVAAARSAAVALGRLGGAPGPALLSWPTDGSPTSGFGTRIHPIFGDPRHHAGIDIPGPTGQPVLAAAGGVVTAAGDRGGYGLSVEVDHGGGVSTLSAHLSGIDVAVGQRVGEAQRIGRLGSTGQSTGPHLHFEVRLRGVATDPLHHY
jgi:murein DD-endopeptidase MepM/ murein hydrolase activator NlpD